MAVFLLAATGAGAAGKAKAKAPPRPAVVGPAAAAPERTQRYIAGGGDQLLILLEPRMIRVGATVRGTRQVLFRDRQELPRGPFVLMTQILEMDCAGARYRIVDSRFFDEQGEEHGHLSKPEAWSVFGPDDDEAALFSQMCRGTGLKLAPAASLMDLRARMFGLEAPGPKAPPDGPPMLHAGPKARFTLMQDEDIVVVLDPAISRSGAYPEGVATIVQRRPNADLDGGVFMVTRMRMDCPGRRVQFVSMYLAGPALQPKGGSNGPFDWEAPEDESPVAAAWAAVCEPEGLSAGPVETLVQLRARYFPGS